MPTVAPDRLMVVLPELQNVGVAGLAVPAVTLLQSGMVNSFSPISGVLVLRTLQSKSFVTATGVPASISGIFSATGVRCRSDGEAKVGSAFFELASLPVVVC